MLFNGVLRRENIFYFISTFIFLEIVIATFHKLFHTAFPTCLQILEYTLFSPCNSIPMNVFRVCSCLGRIIFHSLLSSVVCKYLCRVKVLWGSSNTLLHVPWIHHYLGYIWYVMLVRHYGFLVLLGDTNSQKTLWSFGSPNLFALSSTMLRSIRSGDVLYSLGLGFMTVF